MALLKCVCVYVRMCKRLYMQFAFHQDLGVASHLVRLLKSVCICVCASGLSSITVRVLSPA